MKGQSDIDNHANQMNPNNEAYWESRGWDERPDDWEEVVAHDNDSPGGDKPRKEQNKK